MFIVMSTFDVGVVNGLIVLFFVRFFTIFVVIAFVGISVCIVSSVFLFSFFYVFSLIYIVMRFLVIFMVIFLMGVTLLFFYKFVVYIYINIGGYRLSRVFVRRFRILYQFYVCIFFFVVLEFIVDDVRFGIFLFLFICSIESLNVSCSVWWFLGIWFVFIFENMLVGILVVVWLIMLSMWIIWFYKYFLLYG